MSWRYIVKKIVFPIISIFFIPIKYVVKRRRIVILQTYSRQLYCDNTRYLYEFLSEKKDIYVYWVTDNPKIKQYIKNRGWKYITWHNPIQMIWTSLRAKVVIDNGDGYFDIFNITKPNSVVKISLLHGAGPKATISRSQDIMTAVQQILNMNKFNYVNFTSKYYMESLGKKTYFLPNEKMIKLGYPRCDLFFDENSVDIAYQAKKILRELGVVFNERDKIVLYTPTWRPYKYNFPLSEMPGFSFDDFNKWLQSNDLIFFYTVHANLFPENMPKNLDRIVFIDSGAHPLFDINEFMLEVDILVNDYSTTSTDFSILNRPQVFYMPDYEFYSSEKCFIESYRDIMPGEEVFNYEDFKESLLGASSNPKSYTDRYLSITKELQNKYYDTRLKNSTIKLSEFVQKFL
jgi:CDP-glycerol glycerophosphotransferase (TagB/SpsB family)